MAITTRIAPMYGGQKIFAAVLFLVFGLWGVYDYVWAIPQKELRFEQYEAAMTQRASIIERLERNGFLTETEVASLDAANREIGELAPGGVVPVKPRTWDRATQWAFISCLPFAPWFLVLFFKAKRQKYTLDDDGTLHFTGDPEHQSGAWTQDEIVDIDMSRWMAKSIAWAVHADGRRLKLDAYLHKDLHLIIGAIAHRFYPDEWDTEAKLVKDAEEETVETLAAPEDSATVPERV
jgi:hypothetical protein